MHPLALLAIAGVVVAAYQLTKGPNLPHVALGLGWPLPYVQLAAKWAKRRKLPLEWVLATIIAESQGHPHAIGDHGKSYGLMQVNRIAHAQELRAAGISDAQLFDPAVNIEWGTKYLDEFRTLVLVALRGRRPPMPLDEILRLAYKGPTAVVQVLHAGGSPMSLSWAPDAVANWRADMAKVTALTRSAPKA